MYKHLLCGPAALALAFSAFAQPSFTAHPELLPTPTASGNCMAATDMNGDGRDDLAVMDYSRVLRVLYQNADGRFVPYEYGQVSNEEQWGMAVADMDNDGHKDVLSGGFYDGVHYVRISAPGESVPQDVPGYLFMQCTSAADIDNNGWVDGFGCHDDGAPLIWMNNGLGDLGQQAVIDFNTNPTSDMSGNYGSVFTDFDNDGDIDLYIAKCRQGVNNPADPRRWDRLFVNDGTGHFTDRALEFGVQNMWQTWCVDFGDWDNDGDLDLVALNHDHVMQLFENDGTGHYAEISDGGLSLIGFFLECHMEDFDNDGFLDILIAGSPHVLLQGHGDGTFSNITTMLSPGAAIHSFAVGDLNDDGAMDVWASYGTGYTQPNPAQPDLPWYNDGNDNHWLNVKLRGVASNRGAVGARVTLTTALGTQVREVRSGESYGLTNTSICHFGLAANTTVQTMTVRWPSGLVDTYTNLDADQSITVIEGVCIAPEVGITSSGLHVCSTGDPLTLTAATVAGNYLWSTGAITPSIDVTEPGVYTLTVAGLNTDCSARTAVFITTTDGDAPTISADGPLDLCPAQNVTLTSSEAESYLWTTGETTQSINVSDAGNYGVVVTNGCPDLASNVVTVSALSAPATPTANDVSIPAPGTATLNASDATVNWYADATSTVAVGTGSPWTTPFLSNSATFWCATPSPVLPVTYSAGLPTFGGNTQVENIDLFFPVFTATDHFVLRSVKVYA
ncbi:MAG TPA: FG-GAP-like repeat-containing protein, partial [Flavobacteriales bacterium]|nr:FG-GAP-like repeat-containing protein [Flavobacteriales bacterium]